MDGGVGGVLSYVPFVGRLVPFSGSVDADEEKGEPVTEAENSLQGRCITHWRTFPAAISLLACLIGIICAFIWQYPYLAIPFGVGVATSGIAMCLTRELAHLKSMTRQIGDLEAQNGELKVSLAKLEKSLEESEAQLSKFKMNNEAYAEANRKLVSNIEDMEKRLNGEVKGLKEENASFKAQVAELEKARSAFDLSTASHLSKMEQVRNSLTDVLASADKGKEEFGNKLEELQKALSGIQSVDESIRLKSKEAAELMDKQSKELAATGESMVQLLNKLLDDDKVQKGLKEQEIIHERSEVLLRQQREIQERLEKSNQDLGRIQGSIESLNLLHEKLERQNADLEASLQRKVKQFEEIDKGLKNRHDEIHAASKKVEDATRFLGEEVNRAERVIGSPVKQSIQTNLGTPSHLFASSNRTSTPTVPQENG